MRDSRAVRSLGRHASSVAGRDLGVAAEKEVGNVAESLTGLVVGAGEGTLREGLRGDEEPNIASRL